MIAAEELAAVPLFADVAPALRNRLAVRAGDIHANTGEWITQEGDTPYFWVMLSGEVESVKWLGGVLVQTTTYDPGEYFGDVPLLIGATVFAGIRALKPTRLARIDGADFHTLVTESNEAGAILAQTLVRRVNLIREFRTTVTFMQAVIVGDRYDFACHDIRDFLARNQISFEWLDPGDEVDRPQIPADILRASAYPVVLLADGRRLDQPTQRELAAALGLGISPAAETYDVAIVGGGPAGLAAAVYGGSEGLRTLLIEREAPGGQAGTSSRIENYLGFPSGVSGGDLANRALLQAKKFGTEILVTRSVENIAPAAGGYAITLDGGTGIVTRAVVIATGVTWRKLDADGAAELIGRGVYYGAARTEAVTTAGKDVFLIGGGNSAGQAAMFFAGYARSVTLLVRGASLEASMSHYLIEQLATKANIRVETQTVVTAVRGSGHIEAITTKRGDEPPRERAANGLFVFIGADADTAWLPLELERDPLGYLRTGRAIEAWPEKRAPYMLETSMPGVFAAGDVRSESVKRVAAGVGEGSMAIAYIHQYLEVSAR